MRLLRKEVRGSRYMRGRLRLDEQGKLGFRHICAYKAMRILSIKRTHILSRLYKEGNTLVYTFKYNS